MAVLAVLCGVITGSLSAQDRDLFENHVRPTLVSQCIKCHGDSKQEGGLRLSSLESLLEGVLLTRAGGQGFDKFAKEIQSYVASRRHEISPYEYQIAELTRNQLVIDPDKLPEWLDEAKKAERQRLRAKLAEFDQLVDQLLDNPAYGENQERIDQNEGRVYKEIVAS